VKTGVKTIKKKRKNIGKGFLGEGKNNEK